tara:strand:+ start:473 stop:646 length:174 start_codon:yes stop_codon:yes gene_type:complete
MEMLEAPADAWKIQNLTNMLQSEMSASEVDYPDDMEMDSMDIQTLAMEVVILSVSGI